MLFMATITYGAVIVPILHEFSPESMEEIITHSDSRLVFVNESLWSKLTKERIKVPVFEIPNFTLLNSERAEVKEIIDSLDDLFRINYPQGFSKDDIRYAEVGNEEVICINYTSGTTGFSKGSCSRPIISQET